MPTLPNDFGPLYVETILNRFPVEPWNTWSNLIFLFIVILFARRTGLDYTRHPLIVAGLPILLIGFVGGTVYHATRSHRIWLILDFVPIFILSAAAALRFWHRLTHRWSTAFLILLFVSIVPRLMTAAVDLPFTYRISVGYSSLAFAILCPAFIESYRNRWIDLHLLVGSLLLFAAAVGWRTVDRVGVSLLPMGTHFLWHLFGGLSVWCLMEYIFRRDREDALKLAPPLQ